eukprot:maker-scaffold14_size734282-snap-gene-3.14 protein:Tk11296 transcript:maker-scaffold14_size734282-snap-gene-3.14-mRNA-1 annotation:"protein nlrc3-like"
MTIRAPAAPSGETATLAPEPTTDIGARTNNFNSNPGSEAMSRSGTFQEAAKPLGLKAGAAAWISSEDLLTDGSSTDGCREDLSQLKEQMQNFSPRAPKGMQGQWPEINITEDGQAIGSSQHHQVEVVDDGLSAARANSTSLHQNHHLQSITQSDKSEAAVEHVFEAESICWKPKRGSSFKAHQDLARRVLENESLIERSQEDEKKL